MFRNTSPKKLCLTAAFALLSLGSTTRTAHAAEVFTFTWTGNTNGTNAVWDRPTIDDDPGTYLALVGGGQGYVAQEFTVGVTGIYDYTAVATDAGTNGWNEGDGSILGFLYGGSFDANNSLNDELENGNGDSSWSHDLTAGTDYWIAVTGYYGADSGMLQEGSFAATLSGPGPITGGGQSGTNVGTTPEPASLMLLGTGLLAGVGVIRHRTVR